MSETLRVLFAGEDETACELLRAVLASSAAVVGHVRSGSELSQQLPDLSPHVVLLDLDAPGEDMHSAVQAVREQGQEVGFVALVGDSSVDQAILTAVDAVCYKNASIDRLGASLADIGCRYCHMVDGSDNRTPSDDGEVQPAARKLDEALNIIEEAIRSSTREGSHLEKAGEPARGIEPISTGSVPLKSETSIDNPEKYLSLLDVLPAAIWRASADGQCDHFNRHWLAFTGRTIDQELGEGWQGGIHPDDAGARMAAFRDACASRRPFEVEYRLRRHDGEYRWVIDIGRPFDDRDGQFCGYIGLCFDITERKQNEVQLAYLATHDPLTGLPNRRTFEESFKRVMARARRGTPSVLLFLDLDHFKQVNDLLGHLAGDRTLTTLTQLLQNQLRTEDMLARLGGDEFVALVENATAEDARVVAERIRAAVEDFRFNLDGLTFNLSLSIGLVPIDGQDTPAGIVSKADAAMRKAKERGRNRVMLYRPREDTLVLFSSTDHLAEQLKDALRKGLFVLSYQPIVRLNDGKVDHYEALVRLRGDNGDVILPGEFLPAAERIGLMPRLTRWIVHEAIRTLCEFSQVRLSANLSSLDLSDDALPEYVDSRLRGYKVEPERLGFEVAEIAIRKNLDSAERWIGRLKQVGCRFSLDDFGAGFVSFAHLRNLPIDQFKIDGSFVKTLSTDPSQRTVVQAVQALAKVQGKETVAEWVENEDTVRVLKELGVPLGQGYYLGEGQAGLYV